MAKKILVVEDDRDISELIVFNLKKDGYEASFLYQGDLVFETVQKIKPDLILLDLMLPGMDGIDVCRQIKSDQHLKSTPIIMLTAKNEEADIIVGLQMGADDYIAKPFSPKVLLARIKAVLRRQQQAPDEFKSIRDFGVLSIDLSKHKVYYKKQLVSLTTIEFDILEFLSRYPGRVYTREQILESVWKEGRFIVDRAVDVHVRGLRKKLDDGEGFVETVRGIGYRFKEFEIT